MTKQYKIFLKVLKGTSDKNVAFKDLVMLLGHLGFESRTRGSHHIFYREGITEIINLQEKSGGMAKPYQVKQVRQMILDYKLGDLI